MLLILLLIKLKIVHFYIHYHLLQIKFVGDSSSSSSSSTSSLEYPNDANTFPQFRFKNNGNKKLKTNGMVKGKYYTCCEKGCTARYQVTETYDGKMVSKYSGYHNHAPSPKLRVSKEQKEFAQSAMLAGAAPSNVHKQLVNNATSLSAVPSMSQLYNWKHALSVKDMPTGS